MGSISYIARGTPSGNRDPESDAIQKCLHRAAVDRWSDHYGRHNSGRCREIDIRGRGLLIGVPNRSIAEFEDQGVSGHLLRENTGKEEEETLQEAQILVTAFWRQWRSSARGLLRDLPAGLRSIPVWGSVCGRLSRPVALQRRHPAIATDIAITPRATSTKVAVGVMRLAISFGTLR